MSNNIKMQIFFKMLTSKNKDVQMMQNNYLSGFIPTEIGNLSNLQTL